MARVETRHYVIPTIIEDRSQYVTGVCKCPVDTRYCVGVHVDELSDEEIENGVCHMYCGKCGTYMEVGIGDKQLIDNESLLTPEERADILNLIDRTLEDNGINLEVCGYEDMDGIMFSVDLWKRDRDE